MSRATENAVRAINGTGTGGNEYAIGECLVAYKEDAATPAALVSAARKTAKGKDYGTHIGVAYGAWAIHILGESKDLTPTLAYKYAGRIGADAVMSILAGDADTDVKVAVLKAEWQAKVDADALTRKEAAAARDTLEEHITHVREQVDAMLALKDRGQELTEVQGQAVASLMEDLLLLSGSIKVGAAA